MNIPDGMNHPDNDTLLRYALETADESERGDLGTHLAGCPDCSRALGEITRDLDLISGSDPAAGVPHPGVPPLPAFRYVHLRTAFRAAAAVAVILLGGYLVTGPARDPQISVVPQRFRPAAAVVPAGEFAPCEVVDIAHL